MRSVTYFPRHRCGTDVHRYVAVYLGRGRGQGVTVRMNDGEPGAELRIDFAKLGRIPDDTTCFGEDADSMRLDRWLDFVAWRGDCCSKTFATKAPSVGDRHGRLRATSRVGMPGVCHRGSRCPVGLQGFVSFAVLVGVDVTTGKALVEDVLG